MLRLVAVAALSGVFLVASRSVPSTTLILSVADAKTGAFIAGADVTLPSERRTVRTREDGEARFSGLTAGRYRVQVRALAYAPRDLDLDVTGDSTTVRVPLQSSASPLDTIRVTDRKTDRKIELRMAEFESRRKMKIGRFLTDSALREDRSQSMQWVLATRFAGIQVRDRGIESMQSSGFIGDNRCPVLIYIDGLKVSDVSRDNERMKPESQRLAPVNPKGTLVPQPEVPHRELFPLDNVRPDSLVGVEVYSRTQAPVEYKPLGSYCKVVLLWTRR